MDLTKKIISNYQVTEKIAEGGISYIYLAKSLKNDREKVVIKLLKKKYTSSRIEDLIRFQSEAKIVSKLDHTNIIKIFETGDYKTHHCVIMEYFRGRSLYDVLATEKISLAAIIEFFIKITKTLEYIHSKGIIHRDLKPGNILIANAPNGIDISQFRIIDFGLSQLKELSELDAIGTFGCMSPEQSGVIKRNTDERSDLYSLGIMLYQLIAGEPPYKADSISSLIHQHIAKIPKPFSSIGGMIPKILGKIVFKLMEKEPENRYQSAHGLLYDLEKFSKGSNSFKLGTKDKSFNLDYHTKLIGREKELNDLVHKFNNALGGTGVCYFIHGEAGKGKSRLTEELRIHALSRGKLTVEGKCFSGENKTPYGPFKNILDSYIRDFIKFSSGKKQKLRTHLLYRINELGQIIINLNPGMTDIIGDFPALAELDPDRENKRFLMVVSQFFQNLSTAEGGMAFIIDDLQWADKGSLDLLTEILRNIKDYPLLLIATYRDNEIHPNHILNKFLVYVKENNFSLSAISLESFNSEAMNEFISGLLYEEESRVKVISEFILNKSKGNPFFASEILKQLVLEKAIYLKNDHWLIDHGILGNIEISDNLIDIVIKRILLLDQKEQEILSYAAIIGRKFDIQLLFDLAGLNQIKIVQIIDRAINLQLLEEDRNDKGKILFIHDRIKEAFYKNTQPDQRRILHLTIAEALEKEGMSGIDDSIFDLAHHFIEGKNPDKIVQYAYPAAIKAMNNYANEDALKYFLIVKKNIEIELPQNLSLWVETFEYIGEINLIVGENDKAIDIYKILLDFKETRIDKAKVYKQICIAYFKKGNWKECENNAKEGLDLLGEALPVNKPGVIFGIVTEFSMHLIHNALPFVFKRKKFNSRDEKYRLIVSFYYTLNWSYILTDIQKFIKSVLRMLNIAERKIGKSRELFLSMSGYAGLCMAIPLWEKSLKYHDLAYGLSQELNDDWLMAHSLQFYGFYYQWKGEIEKSSKYFNQSEERYQKLGDIWEIATIKNGQSANYFFQSRYAESIRSALEWRTISERTKDNFGITNSNANLLWAFAEKGNFKEAQRYGSQGIKISSEKDQDFTRCLVFTYLGHLYTEMSMPERAMDYLVKSRELDRKNNFIKVYTSIIYPYLCEAMINHHKKNEKNLSLKEKRESLKKINKACVEARKKTRPWALQHGSALRLSAKYFQLIDKSKKSRKYYNSSLKWLKQHSRNFELAKCLYDFGMFNKEQGSEKEATQSLRSSYRIFKEIDSIENINHLTKVLGIKEEPLPGERLMEKQKLSSVIKVSQDISSILDLSKLLKVILIKSIEVTGARGGYLFIFNDGTGELELKTYHDIEDAKGHEFSLAIIKNVFKTGKMVLTFNASMDDEYKNFPSVIKYNLKSILAVPIVRHDKAIGVCYLDNPLSSGVFTEEDATLLNVFINQAAIALENASLYNDLEKKVEQRTKELSIAYEKLNLAYSKMKDDLSLARKIQDSILPKDIKYLPGITLHIEYLPLLEVGGDIYDLYNCKRNKSRIFLADATGHGVGASLVTMLIKSEYEKLKITDKSPSDIFYSLNDVFFNTYGSLKIFFTGIIIDIYLEEKKIIYASAGHPAQCLIKKGELILLNRTGRAVSIAKEINCKNVEMEFAAGNRILLFTDGLYEEFNKDREEFGEERIFEALNKHSSLPLSETIKIIKADLDDFIKDSELNDDITIIGIES